MPKENSQTRDDPFFELAIKQKVPKFERWLEREIKRV